MTLLEGMAQRLADQMASTLPEEAKQRVSALLTVRAVMPDADAWDRIRLANYIVTGSDRLPGDPEPAALISETAPAEGEGWQGHGPS